MIKGLSLILLSANEKKLIENEIENIEKKSSAELVAVVSNKISNYRYLALIVNIVITAIISLQITLLQVSAFELFKIQVLLFSLIFIIFFKFDTLVLYFLPRKYINKLCEEHAKKEFSKLRLNKTQTKQALMFFVSLNEKYVQIIVDENISLVISDEYWQEIVDEFIKDVKRDQISNGYLKVIQACSDILIEKCPIQANDINELPNEVIELRY